MHGWIILDKPSGITSAHAVARVKRWVKDVGWKVEGDSRHPSPATRHLKIGHAGTLDPLASGILPLALGEATKTVAYMMDAAKSYSFTVKWGEERDTDDSEGQLTRTSPERPSRTAIERILSEFTGTISQTPPSYSAVSVNGQRAYAMARAGQEVTLAAREVVVESLVIASPLRGEADAQAAGGGEGGAILTPPVTPSLTLPPQGGGNKMEETSFICHCGKGTYIRSLARDMGRRLGCYGHIVQLRRLKVGNFTESDAISLEVLEKMGHKDAPGFLRPVASALDDIPALDLTPSQAARLRRGQTVVLPQTHLSSTVMARCDGNLVAIGEVRDGILKPVRVFNL